MHISNVTKGESAPSCISRAYRQFLMQVFLFAWDAEMEQASFSAGDFFLGFSSFATGRIVICARIYLRLCFLFYRDHETYKSEGG